MTMTNINQKAQLREAVSFSGQFIHIGLDVHKKNWSVSVYLNATFVKTYHQEPSGKILFKYLSINYPGATQCHLAKGNYGFGIRWSTLLLHIEPKKGRPPLCLAK